MIAQTIEELTPLIGTRPACRALGASVATTYRRRRPPAPPRPRRPRPTPERALTQPEREQVLEVLASSGSLTSPRRRPGRRYWTKARTCARRERCTGS